MLQNSTILITGGTGSFGNTFVLMALETYNPFVSMKTKINSATCLIDAFIDKGVNRVAPAPDTQINGSEKI